MSRTIPIQAVSAATASATSADGLGCHAGADTMRQAAMEAGKSETLAQYAKDSVSYTHLRAHETG
jgi:chlorophyllide a reductase subunit Y